VRAGRCSSSQAIGDKRGETRTIDAGRTGWHLGKTGKLTIDGENMEQCGCCGTEARKIRPFQRIWGDESSEVGLCSNCFTDAVSMAQEIRDLSGTISLAMLKAKEFQIDLADGRTILAKVQE
jgi:hypothetical protein